jgi:Protein of unknown function (DUF2867)
MTAQVHLVRPEAEPEHDSRFVRPVRIGRAHATRRPSTPLLAHSLPSIDWSDAYAVGVPRHTGRRDAQAWADAIFRAPPPLLVRVLFGARTLVVRAAGIERGGRHVFDTISRTENEVLLGADQAHLGFRASVLVEPDRVVLSTVVELRNRRGRLYFALVRHVHPIVVRGMLAGAARTMASTAEPLAEVAR